MFNCRLEYRYLNAIDAFFSTWICLFVCFTESFWILKKVSNNNKKKDFHPFGSTVTIWIFSFTGEFEFSPIPFFQCDMAHHSETTITVCSNCVSVRRLENAAREFPFTHLDVSHIPSNIQWTTIELCTFIHISYRLPSPFLLLCCSALEHFVCYACQFYSYQFEFSWPFRAVGCCHRDS